MLRHIIVGAAVSFASVGPATALTPHADPADSKPVCVVSDTASKTCRGTAQADGSETWRVEPVNGSLSFTISDVTKKPVTLLVSQTVDELSMGTFAVTKGHIYEMEITKTSSAEYVGIALFGVGV